MNDSAAKNFTDSGDNISSDSWQEEDFEHFFPRTET
jgi:hypothetical protein